MQNSNNGRLYVLVARPPSIIAMDPDGSNLQTIVGDCTATPDGITIDKANGHLYWTNMGEDFSANDGFIERVNLDGSNRVTIIPAGGTFTPKQLQIDTENGLLYWCDREGMRVMRARTDGKEITVLVQTGSTPADRADETRHCVGIALDQANDYLYWTQKGPEDAGLGRIFRTHLTLPGGMDPSHRTDIETLFEGLPEPIDLEIDHAAGLLYWTDRGSPPNGNTLNCAKLTATGCVDHQILMNGLEEGIGLALDLKGHRAFVTDLGGKVHLIKLEDPRTSYNIFTGGPLTGIAFMPG